jgi:hypothetical protein
MRQETAAQNINSQLKSSVGNEMIEEIKKMDNSTSTLKDHQPIKKSPWHGCVVQA